MEANIRYLRIVIVVLRVLSFVGLAIGAFKTLLILIPTLQPTLLGSLPISFSQQLLAEWGMIRFTESGDFVAVSSFERLWIGLLTLLSTLFIFFGYSENTVDLTY